MELVFILLVVFQIKHLIADYYLQFPAMYENKGKPLYVDWFMPLFAHAYVHGVMTMSILIVVFSYHINFSMFPVLAAFIDICSHMAIDRWKATQPEGPNTSKFWYNLGIDQMLHHLVGIVIIYGAYTILI